MKYFNTNASNNTNNDTYDGKIRDKISDIRAILGRLGNIVTKMIERKLKKIFMKQKIRPTFQIRKKKRLMIVFLN